MKINGREVDVTRFSWSQPGGELHIDIIKLMAALGIPWSKANELRVTRDVIEAIHLQTPQTRVIHLVDRKPPAKQCGN